jgi:hypothetical protein
MPKTYDTTAAQAFIACPGDHYIWAAYTDEQSAAADLPAVLADQPGKAYEVMTDWDAFTSAAQAKFMTPALEITEAEYWEALECLPPMQWKTAEGVERFCISEFTFGNITNQYAKKDGRYIAKAVRFNDLTTYINAADFAALPAQVDA